MKRTIPLLLALVMCLVLAACGGGAPAETAPAETTAAPTEATEVTEETVDKEQKTYEAAVDKEQKTYEAALAAMAEKQYEEAIGLFQELGGYEDARSRMKLCQLYAYDVVSGESHFEYMIPRIETYEATAYYTFNIALTNRGDTPLVLKTVEIVHYLDGIQATETQIPTEDFGRAGLGFDALHPGQSVRWGDSCPVDAAEGRANEMLYRFTFEDTDGQSVEYNYMFYPNMEDPSYEREGGYIIPDFREVDLGNGPEVCWDYQHNILNDTDTALTLVSIETYQKMNGMNTISVWYHTDGNGVNVTYQPGETFDNSGDVHPVVDTFNEVEQYYTFLDPDGNEVVKILKYRLTMPDQ